MEHAEKESQKNHTYPLLPKLSRRKMLSVVTGALLLPVIAKNEFFGGILSVNSEASADGKYPKSIRDFFPGCINAAAGNGVCHACLQDIRAAFHTVGPDPINTAMHVLGITQTITKSQLDNLSNTGKCVDDLQNGEAPCSTVTPPPKAVIATFTLYLYCLAGIIDNWKDLSDYERNRSYKAIAAMFMSAIKQGIL